MQQVLFTIPFFRGSFQPDGIPMYGFGAMLFLCFVSVTLWGTRRAKRTADMPPERFQDMVIWLFVSGIVGARILYMIQYANTFPDHSILGLVGAFFKIWEGGIIFYGSALGGVIGYGLFYWFILRKLHIDGWRLADAVAPLLALGLAIGRIGCYLNGCCYGQVACEECVAVPLGAAHFPLLPAHARSSLVTDASKPNEPAKYKYLQTTTGFIIESRPQFGPYEDPRTRVRAVEVGSPADRAGVKPGDLVTKVNGAPNSMLVDLSGSEEKVDAAVAMVKGYTGSPQVLEPIRNLPGVRKRLEFDDLPVYLEARSVLRGSGVDVSAYDRLEDKVRDWPRGQSKLALTVEREGTTAPVDLAPFVPETVGLYPTQLYETVSMVLLILLLLAYYPYRRHDGQLMVLLMVGYAIHRFINESLRIEPSVGLGLTLSQWGSVVIFVAAIGIETYLRWAMPSRWSRGTNPPAAPSTVPPVAPTAVLTPQ